MMKKQIKVCFITFYDIYLCAVNIAYLFNLLFVLSVCFKFYNSIEFHVENFRYQMLTFRYLLLYC